MPDIGARHEATVDRIAARFGLQVRGDTPLVSSLDHTDVGGVRTLLGPEVDKAVALDLTVADGDEPSALSWFYAFARTTALVPHLAVEWSEHGSTESDEGPRVGLLIDLLPRLDLAVNVAYVDEVYVPITEVLESGWEIDGVRAARIRRRRAICFSPWLFSVTAPLSEIDALQQVVDRCVDHWIAVTSGGVSAPVDPVANDPTKLVQHDRFHRNALFDEASDPRWDRIYRLLGPNDAAELRMTLRTQEAR